MKRIKIFYVFVFVLTILFNSNLTMAEDKKVDVCHKTESSTNPWGVISINENGWGHGHEGHEDDFLYTGGGDVTDKDAWCMSNAPTSPTPKSTLVATKIVCEDEADLPNWGEGDANINSDTAGNFLASHPNCTEAPRWAFEWIESSSQPSPSDDDAVSLAGWTSFTSSDDTIPVGKMIWVREQFDTDYIGFTGANTDQDISAELYCDSDVLHYDNLEWVNTQGDTTHYCVAFNVLKEKPAEPEQCNIISDTTNITQYDTTAVETWVHPNWISSITDSLAKWIWPTYKISYPDQDEKETFTKMFTVGGDVTSAEMQIAGDNLFYVEINGVEVEELDRLYDGYISDDNFSSLTGPVDVKDYLVDGLNTIKITVKNISMPGGTQETNPAGLLYNLEIKVHGSCSAIEEEPSCSEGQHFDVDANSCVDDEEPVICDPQINLLENGDFENPDISTGSYSIVPDINIDAGSVLGWLVSWMGEPTSGTLGLEIQDHIAGDPYLNNQYAELDGDHPVKIWQDVTTIPGKEYKLEFAYSPREGRDAKDNEITLNIGDNLLSKVLSAVGLSSGTSWIPYTETFIATDDTTKIEFADTSTDTSFGGYLDAVGLYCQGDPEHEDPIGSIQITKYVCPTGTTVVRSANGVNGQVPAGCTLQSGATFGYVHGEATNPDGPWPELDASYAGNFDGEGVTGTNGILMFNNLPATGRYSIVETNSNGIMLSDNDILGLYCEGDGDTSDKNDNHELTFVLENGIAHCVAYNKVSVVPVNGTWSDWTPATSECGEGTFIQERTCQGASNGGTCLADEYGTATSREVQRETCTSRPVDGTWSDWTPATSECGEGTFTQERTCQGASNGGTCDGSENGTIQTRQQQRELCVPEPRDLCSNITGIQTEIPRGKILRDGKCISRQSYGGSIPNGGAGEGQVLGAETSCGIYVDKYLRKGYANDVEAVKKVQKFLNEYMSAGLTEDGFFGDKTETALKAFQLKQADKILTPWNIEAPTGIFYLTTQTEVNNIMCPDLKLPIPSSLIPFSLNSLVPRA